MKNKRKYAKENYLKNGTKIQNNFCSKLVHCVMIDKKKTPKEREENDDQRIH